METQVALPDDRGNGGQRTLPFIDRFRLNEGALLEPLAGSEPIDQLDPETVSGIADLPKELVQETIRDYTIADEALPLLVKYRDIRVLNRLNEESNRALIEPRTHVAPKPQRREVPKKPFEDLAREKLFADPDTPALNQISSLVAKKPKDWRILQTICRVLTEHHDLDDANDQTFANSVAETFRVAYSRHLFNKDSSKQNLPEDYIGPWIAGLLEAKPGFEQSIQTELIKKSIESIRPDASVNQMLVIITGYTLGMSKLKHELGEDDSKLASIVESIMATMTAKLHQYPEARLRLRKLADQATVLYGHGTQPSIMAKTVSAVEDAAAENVAGLSRFFS